MSHFERYAASAQDKITSAMLSITTANTSGKSNHSSNEILDTDEILRELNAKKVLLLLPVIIFVFLTITIGIVGNFLVCYIYRFRLRRSPSRYFILFLAVLDLISCFVGAASELSDLFQPYVFTATWSCKILRFGLSFTIISASFTLICVAFDRYYKVCRPLKAFPVKKVKILCAVVVLLSIGLASPALAIFGLKSVKVDGYAGLIGTECSTADNVRKSALPIVYYIILFSAFLVLLTSFILLYVKIGIEIWKRKKRTIGETLPTLIKEINNVQWTRNTRSESVPLDDPSSRSVDEYSETRAGCESIESRAGCDSTESRAGCENASVIENDSFLSTLDRTKTINSYTLNEQKSVTSRPVLRRRRSNLGRMSIRTLRTTSIFFAVSAAFVLSFLPYLIANILKFTKVAFSDIQNSAEEVTYNFCARSYFISNCINPIIYSALNVNFRKECKKLLKRILRRIKLCCLCRSE
ncbi:D(2) dopamine receptor-like [Mercenaria mercenaria]|uniref:D(2) dopamine receptor-like n=1 Tax=Mercenaria mercenaria TaxID=6596 RepID=UPI00234E3CCD|nr:D(2) dopamine receptor-like [Mercenaria mercenaria]XP_045161035.2 D(2) dopamine receptor-like [Mercenaria mercenaria]XP_045161042.2 D(2) dopamine receptor-like [Mercenaria mercenaria]